MLPLAMMTSFAAVMLNALTLLAFYIGALFGGTYSFILDTGMSPVDLPVEEIMVGEHDLDVWVARTDEEKSQGLSWLTTSELDEWDVDGMLFVFDEPAVQSFWMYGMQFDLDFIWIADGEVVKVDENVLTPDNNNGGTIQLDSEPFEVDYVLELPAGLLEVDVEDAFSF